MPVCILGMHRSGTSMVTRMLNLCGLYLGADDDLMPPHAHDNAAGYWENMRFVRLNEDILAQLGGRWDEPPPLQPAWWQQAAFDPLREQARNLLTDLENHAPWGWKDPRTCLTLPFWQDLLPDLKLVCCLRNPLDVMLSLGLRTNEPMLSDTALSLWAIYHERLLQTVDPAHLVVTHFATYFYDAQAELRRVLDALGLVATDTTLAAATQTLQPDLQHVTNDGLDLSDQNLSHAVVDLYDQFKEACGSVYKQMRADEAYEREQLKQGQRKHYLLLAAESDRAIQALRTSEGLQTEKNHLQQTINHLTSERDALAAMHAQFHEQIAALADPIRRMESQQAALVDTIHTTLREQPALIAERDALAQSVTRFQEAKASLETHYSALQEEQATLVAERAALTEAVTQLKDEQALLSEKVSHYQNRLTTLEAKHASLTQTIEQVTREKNLLAAEHQGLLHALGTLADEKHLFEAQRDRLQQAWHALQQSFLGRTLFRLQDHTLDSVPSLQRRSANGYTPLRILLDAPAAGSSVSLTNPLPVRGWAVSAQGPISRMKAFLGARLLGTLDYGLERPDVAQAFPDEAHARHSGFHQQFDVADVQPGRYELVVLATDEAGNAHAVCQPLILTEPVEIPEP